MALPLVPVVALGFFVTWLVLYGMTHGLQTWLASLINALAHPRGSFWKVAVLKVAGALVGAAAYVFRTVGHAVSQAASHGTARVAHYFGGLTLWLTHNAIVAGDFAESTAHGFERLVTHTIPHAVARAIAVPIHEVKLGLRHAERDLEQLRRYARGIDTLVRDTIWPALRRVAHAVDVTLPRSLGRVRARVGAAERAISRPSSRWVKAIWKRGWILVGAGLMVKFLAKKFPWLFCRNVKSYMPRFCGLDSGLLDLLFLEATVLTGTLSVVEFTRELQAVEDEAIRILGTLIDEL